jgi:hypothetical protein
LWFEQHPRRCFHFRYMVIAEFGLHREDPYAGIWNLSYTIIFRSRRSGRMKKWPFWVSLILRRRMTHTCRWGDPWEGRHGLAGALLHRNGQR